MSILESIKKTIVKERKVGGVWKFIDDSSTMDTSEFRVINPNTEIFPELWAAIASTGVSTLTLTKEMQKKYTDADGENTWFGKDIDFDEWLNIGAIQLGSVDSDFEESDFRFLLTEENKVFRSDNWTILPNSLWVSYIWGSNSKGVISEKTASTLASGGGTLGLMGFIANKSYSKKILEQGIDTTDKEAIERFVQVYSDKSTFPFESYDNTWKEQIDLLRKNLLATTRDIASIVDGVAEGVYNLDTFVKKISIATSFILEYGEFKNLQDIQEKLFLDETDMILKEYTAGSAEQQQLQALGLPLDNTTSNAATRTEQAIADEYTENYVRYVDEEVWNAMIRGGYIYASTRGTSAVGAAIQFMTSNYNNWLKIVPGEYQDVKELNYGTLDNADKEIVDFLSGTDTYKDTITTTYWKINDNPDLDLSNKVDGKPRNVRTYETQTPLYLDRDRKVKWSFEEQILEEYYSFAILLKTRGMTTYIGSDGKEYFSLTKEMDKKAFDLADIVAETVVANRINDLKARLFVKLTEIIADPDNDDISKIESESAKAINDGSNLGYEEDEISQKEIANRQKLLEQCALLLNLVEINNAYNAKNAKEVSKEMSGSVIHKDGYFNNRFLRMQGNAGSRTVTSLYAQRESVKAFLEMNPAIQGLLVPKIKIQKIIVRQGVTHTIEVPFTAITTNLDSKTPIDYKQAMSNRSVFRGGGVGIKSISFDFDGETPATAQKWVRSTMSLKFQDFADLVNERSTTKVTNLSPRSQKVNNFRFIDLIVNSTENPTSDDGYDAFFREHYKPDDYKIKIEVGWNCQRNNATRDLIQSQLNIYKIGTPNTTLKADDFFNAIDKQNKTFLFAALDHDLNINDDGTVDLNINYFGYPDALLNSSKFNALVTNKEQKKLKTEQDELFEKIKNGQCTANQLAKLQGAIEARKLSIVKKSSQSIINRITANGTMRQVKITDVTQLTNFKQTGAFTKVPKIETNLSSGFSPTVGDTKSFFLLGDLLYVIMDCLYLNGTGPRIEGTENISFILTDFEFVQHLGKDGATNKKVQINLASIPISTDFFKEWFTDEIISSERYNYPIMEFILVLLNRLLGDILTEVCFNKKADKTLFFRQAQMFGSKVQNDNFTAITNYGPDGTVSSGIINIEPENVRSLLPLSYDSSTGGGAHDMYTFIAIYPDFKPETHGGKGNYSNDMEKGIYHFHVGAATGLLKKINFSKTNITYLRESRMMRHRGIGDFAQLSNVYNVSLELFGNFLFFPGMQIFIDPFGIGGKEFGRPQGDLYNADKKTINYAKLMGIGGYHLITSVKTTIGTEGFKTQVEARFFFSGDDKGNDKTIDGLIQREQEATDVGVPDDGTDTSSCNEVLSTFETTTIQGANE